MDLEPLGIDGAFVSHSAVHSDERGDFLEWFKLKDLETAIGSKIGFTQGNVSRSNKMVLRGIHYSTSSVGQSKWVTCIKGHILDYIIDLRQNSPTFKHWKEVELKGLSGDAVFVPQGFGHAFLSMEDDSIVTYLVSSDFNPEAEKAINPFDQDLGIRFPGKNFVVSDKDLLAPSLKVQQEANLLPREFQKKE